MFEFWKFVHTQLLWSTLVHISITPDNHYELFSSNKKTIFCRAIISKETLNEFVKPTIEYIKSLKVCVVADLFNKMQFNEVSKLIKSQIFTKSVQKYLCHLLGGFITSRLKETVKKFLESYNLSCL